MKKWLRIVVPDLFLASVVALLVTLAMQHVDGAEAERIHTETRAAARDGLTLDERIDVLAGSIRRSTILYLPVLIALSGVAIGLVCRHRRWAWLTAIGAVLPAMAMGVAFFFDRPVHASALTTIYTLLAISMASAGSALRRRLQPQKVRSEC